MIFLDLGTSNYSQMKDDLIALTTVRVGIAQLANIKIARCCLHLNKEGFHFNAQSRDNKATGEGGTSCKKGAIF